MMRHVGKLAQTDTRCVIVMMQIPGREDHALVVESDSLPEHYHQTIMQILESKEGQANTNFAEELGRNSMFIANHGNMSVLQALHEAKFLRPALIDSVVMTPSPGASYPLRKVLESMGIGVAGEKTVLDSANDPSIAKFNPHVHNQEIRSADDKIQTATGILRQADLVSNDATKLREQAYALAPELRPRAENLSISDIQAPTLTNIPVEDTPQPKKKRGRPAKSTKKVSIV